MASDSTIELGLADAGVDANLSGLAGLKKSVTPEDAFLVAFSNNDPAKPHSWTTLKKSWLTLQMGMLAFAGSFGASVISPAQDTLVVDFHISEEVSILAVSLFVLGYAFGPALWAPVGEVYGRKASMIPPVFVLGLFSVGTAVSRNAASIFITRFFGGVFASAPVSNASAAIGDFFDAKSRAVPMSLMSVAVIGGPCLGPIVGAAIVVNPNMGWRWTMYIQAILSFFVAAVTSLCLPETYQAVILKRKAIQLRKETGESRYWHPHERQKMSVKNIVTKYISRPVRMLTTEPIVTAIALYASFVYGLLFFQLESFPIVFYEERGYSLLVSTLPFLGLFTGVILAVPINFLNQPFYKRAVKKNHGKPVPEARLPPLLAGGLLFSGGLFWFGWTAAPRYSWAFPAVAAGFIGGGFTIIFQNCLNYLSDSYGPLAASAMAGNTILRSTLACGLPLAAIPLFTNLGVGPACSLLGGISCLALPIPFLFMKYGKRLRQKSRFALKD